MASLINQLAVLLTVVAVSSAQQLTTGLARPTNSRNFNCPQENGQFENRDDCTTYWECQGNQPTLRECHPQLIFNPATGYCDWPLNTGNPGCARNSRYAQTICQENTGGNPGEAFLRPHPGFCNVFYTCSSFFVHTPCTVCPAGTYFPEGATQCISYGEQDVSSLCSQAGKRFVEAADSMVVRLECWPFGNNYANPNQAFADQLKSGFRNTVRPFQPTLPNRGG
ncbi:unnamed protein product [Lymnaea stagnalis]|uniref:Chitin-binding type-2 domain-containing protein n=1 Tax=Lymnaea stagnalis TaxID=6523 RepID=A0AAV2GZ24_LYMST